MTAIDPKHLTRAQLNALEIIAGARRLFRCPGGWSAAGFPKITLAVVGLLARKGLVRRGDRGQLVVTGSGSNTLAVAEARKGRAA